MPKKVKEKGLSISPNYPGVLFSPVFQKFQIQRTNMFIKRHQPCPLQFNTLKVLPLIQVYKVAEDVIPRCEK